MKKLDVEIYKQIREYALKLVIRGYVTAHGGNISVREGNSIWITRHATSLEEVKRDDIVRVYVGKPSDNDIIASTEAIVHREIYKNSGNLVVMHVHPPYSVALSFFYDEIIPSDVEGYHIMKKIPVVEGAPGSKELAENVSNALSKHLGVIVRGHGVFTASKSIETAYHLICIVEHSSEIFYLKEMMKSHYGDKFI
ncbi:MAG: class II aldolase/adducin family protein [Candidatus Wukongarchaeota archaeon]|nr:class II aldolase/adducin family protein [Candidatus Wukongarchaeota archaeon]